MPHRKVDWSSRRAVTVTMTNTGVTSVPAGASPPAPVFDHMTFGDTGVE